MGTKIYIIISALFVLITGGGSFLVNKNLGANTQISALPIATSLDDSDEIIVNINSSGTPTTKKITVANATSSLQTFYDTLYSPIFSTSAGLFGLISNETGSGSLVGATSPTITSATMTTPYINVSGTEAKGDLLYLNDSGGELVRLAIGAANSILTVSSGVPAWASASSDFSFGFTRSTGLLSTASSTIYGLTVGSSLAATTTNNLVVENNASTTNLTVSKVMRLTNGSTLSGFASSTAYEQVTGGTAGPTTNGSSANVSVNCSSGKIVLSCGADISESTSEGVIEAVYPSDIDTCYARAKATANGAANTLTVYGICVTQ